MNNIDYTKIERPVEPAFDNEDPEGWVEVLAWEEARADKLEQEVGNLKGLNASYVKANKNLRYDLDQALEHAKEVLELKEVLRDLSEKFEHTITCQGRNPESWGAYRKALKLLNK